jgi:hypothetical protein
MGKKNKNKNKNKISGSEKTALKTEKKRNIKQKKELAARGEVSFSFYLVSEIQGYKNKYKRIKNKDI